MDVSEWVGSFGWQKSQGRGQGGPWPFAPEFVHVLDAQKSPRWPPGPSQFFFLDPPKTIRMQSFGSFGSVILMHSVRMDQNDRIRVGSFWCIRSECAPILSHSDFLFPTFLHSPLPWLLAARMYPLPPARGSREHPYGLAPEGTRDPEESKPSRRSPWAAVPH